MMKSLRKLISVLILSSLVWGQATVSVPVVGSPTCQGDLCTTPGEAVASVASTPDPQPVQTVPQHPEHSDPLTEFQQFVSSSTGQRLPIYGRSLFRDVPSTFAPADHIAVPADYVMGPGDELFIRAWGQIDIEAKVTVDRGGEIFLPKVGTIAVAGTRFSQINSLLKTDVGRLFKNFDLSVSMGQLRSIQILIVGRAKHPGVYTVSSLSTLTNALFASGGPDVNGSMRHIQLKRGGRVVADFDLYDLLVKADRSKDVNLLPDDVIFIPPVGSQVAIFGSVNFPAIYEARDNSTVAELIDTCGGLTLTASSSKAVLERIENRSHRNVEEFPLNDSGLARKLQAGDVLRIFPISPKFENAITLRGNVAQPGRYPWRTGMRFRDLIPSRDAIITRDYWLEQGALGVTSQGWQNEDDPTNRAISHYSAHEINWDYALIQRMNDADLTPELIPFNLGRAIADANSSDNLLLQPGDVITIFSQNDVAVPSDKRTRFVRIEGEVNAPGVYRVSTEESLRTLVERAGGLTPNAYLYAAEFRRQSTREEQSKNLRKAVEQMETELRLRAAELKPSTEEDRRAVEQQLTSDRAAIEALRKVEPTGRIVLDLKPDAADIATIPDFPLEDGDALLIPSRPATVEVLGAVYNQSALLYTSGKPVREYLKRAGGPTRGADDSRTFIIRADGSVVSKQMSHSLWASSFENMRLMPGDTIVVPQKTPSNGLWRGIRDWSQVFAQFALGAAAVKVIGQ